MPLSTSLVSAELIALNTVGMIAALLPLGSVFYRGEVAAQVMLGDWISPAFGELRSAIGFGNPPAPPMILGHGVASSDASRSAPWKSGVARKRPTSMYGPCDVSRFRFRHVPVILRRMAP
jgi:hypothetical protein